MGLSTAFEGVAGERCVGRVREEGLEAVVIRLLCIVRVSGRVGLG